MGWKELQSDEVYVTPAVAESNRFGFPVLNIQCGLKTNSPFDVLRKTLEEVDYQIAVVRYPAVFEDIGTKLSGLNLRQTYADSTVYWSSERVVKNPEPISSELRIFEISIHQLSDVISVIDSSFDNYRSHWHYNPRTKHLRMPAAYAEWVTNAMKWPDTTCYLMTHGDVPAGMAMTQIGEDFAEILLAGIAKNFQAKGLYQQLLQYVATDLRRKEMHQIVISTQSGNTNVQKAWARYGLLPALSIQTVHIERK